MMMVLLVEAPSNQRMRTNIDMDMHAAHRSMDATIIDEKNAKR